MTLPLAAPGSAEDPRCVRCGYSLIGLDSRRPCPECGLLAGFSLLDGRELRHNRPRWLLSLALGAGALATGTLAFPGVGIAVALFQEAAGDWQPSTDWTLWSIAVVLATVPSVGLPLGAWLITGRAGAQRIEQTGSSTRVGLRALSFAPFLLMSLSAASSARLLGTDWLEFAVSPSAWLGTFVCLAIFYAWLFWHMKSLAARAPAPMLAADSPIVGTVLGACILLVIGCGVALSQFEYHYRTAIDVLNTAMGVIVAVGLTAGIWSIYLLIRYAIAFGRSARQARQLMADFDASRQPAVVVYDPPP